MKDIKFAKLLQTSLTEDGADDIVRLEISDAPLPIQEDAIDAAIRIEIYVRVAGRQLPLVAHVQLDALDATINTLKRIRDEIYSAAAKDGQDMRPRPRGG